MTRLLSLFLCLTILACAPKVTERDAAPETTGQSQPVTTSPREIALAIEASKVGLRAESRAGTASGVAVGETRYYVGQALVLVEEIVGSLDAGGSETAFYFDDDRLVYFRGRGTRTFFVPGGEETRERFDIELGFDHDGNVVDSIKTVDGEPAELEALDYEAPKVRARMLLSESGER